MLMTSIAVYYPKNQKQCQYIKILIINKIDHENCLKVFNIEQGRSKLNNLAVARNFVSYKNTIRHPSSPNYRKSIYSVQKWGGYEWRVY